MALSPMDIHHKEFNTVRMGGYNKEEVDAFLDQVADELDRQLHRNQELMNLVESMRARVAEYDSMQQTLQNALINAQKSADAIVQEARAQAEQSLQQAQAQATQLLENARSEADALERQARQARDDAVREAAAEKQRLMSEFSDLEGRFKSFLDGVRGLIREIESSLKDCESRVEATAGATIREEERAPVSITEAMMGAEPMEAAEPREFALDQKATSAPAEMYAVPEAPPIETQEQPLFEPAAYVTPEAREEVPQDVKGLGKAEPFPAAEAAQAPFAEAMTSEQGATAAPAEPQAYVPPIAPLQEVREEESPIPPIHPEAATAEPQAYVPPIAPLQEVREEESPIPPIHPEAATAEPQAYVPPIRFAEGEAASGTRPGMSEEVTAAEMPGPVTPPPWEAAPSQEEQPVTLEAAPEVPETPEEPKEEKHFFWE